MCDRGPGPGAYLLPPTVGFAQHDPSKYRNPMYSIGRNANSICKAESPGPAYNIENMTRYGKSKVPAYSLASRNRDMTPFNVPGPGTYTLDNGKRNPAFTMAARFNELSRMQSPGPNQYSHPSSLGPKIPNKPASAAYSIVGNHGLSEKAKSPGPATYGQIPVDNFRQAPPRYSMVGRHGLSPCEPNPGPAAYLPKVPKSCSAGYSFGNRTIALPYITADDVIPCITRGG